MKLLDFRARASKFLITKNFGRLWTATIVRGSGASIGSFALPIIAVAFCGATAAEAGVLVALKRIGSFSASVVAGALVEHRRKVPIMLWGEMLSAAVSVAAAYVVLQHPSGLAALYVLAASVGVLETVYSVCHIGILRSIVGRSRIGEAATRIQATDTVTDTAVPLGSGLLTTVMPTPLLLVVGGAFHAAAAPILLLIKRADSGLHSRADTAGETVRRRVRRFASAVKSGFRFLFGQQLLRIMTMQNMLRNFGIGILAAVETVILMRHVGLTAADLGIISTVAAIVALVSTFIGRLLRRSVGELRLNLVIGLLLPMPILGVGLAALIPASGFAIMMIAESLLSALITVRTISVAGLRARMTPDDMLSRGNAANKTLLRMTFPIGSLLGGALSLVIGPLWCVAACAAVILAAGVYGISSPLGRYRNLPQRFEVASEP